MKTLLKCPKCSIYTMNHQCPECGNVTISPHPAKFSISDRYVRYRWMLKKESERHGADSS